jgi:acyl-CoA reductase-like NAD-dependent aldehyde dehydrogenase
MKPTNLPTVSDQVASARAAQATWAAQPLRTRLRLVRALRHLLAVDPDALCAAVAADVGKTVPEILGGDVLPLAEACRFLELEAKGILRLRRIPNRQRPVWLMGQEDTVYRRPRGVVGIIGTWNYPLFLNGVQIVQALTAGNAVVWKPSEVAPASALVLHTFLMRAGFPADLVQLLPATREAGPLLAEADIDHLVFTGSADVGRKLARRLGERLISSTMELSGCDAQIVLEDADVALAARAAWFGFQVNRGQTCIAVRRSLVQQSVYPAFCEQLRSLAPNATLCRLALPSQVEQAERLVRAAVAEGGQLLAAPSDRPLGPGECWPAIVLDARPDMDLCREASFAPLLAVLPCASGDEAVTLDARCPYALATSVFTRTPSRASALAARLRAGAVTVNDVVAPTGHPATPFGGQGASGWGSTQGMEGLLEMTVPQVVSVRGGTFRPHFDLSNPAKAQVQNDLLRGMLQLGHAPTLGQRLGGWWQVLKAMWRGV